MSNKETTTGHMMEKANSMRKQNSNKWSRARPIQTTKDNRFGAEVKWKFPEVTTFEGGHWYRKVLVNEHEKMKEDKTSKSKWKRMVIS